MVWEFKQYSIWHCLTACYAIDTFSGNACPLHTSSTSSAWENTSTSTICPSLTSKFQFFDTAGNPHELRTSRFHYGRNYYSQLLKKYRGLSFRDYVQELRMEQARHYLSEANMPIRQIALLCGYENTNFFYHLFHRTFGIHPMDYRMSSRYDSDPI